MAFERMIKNAFEESRNNARMGDTFEELNEIQEYIKNAKKIYVLLAIIIITLFIRLLNMKIYL